MSVNFVSSQISNIINNYVDDRSKLGKFIHRTKYYDDLTEYVTNFFLNFLTTNPSYLRYDCHLNRKELARRGTPLTCHLTDEHITSINEKGIKDHEVNFLISTLQQPGGFLHLVADLRKFHRYPTQAFLGHMFRNDITRRQVATLCMTHQAIDQFLINPERIMIRRNRTVNECTVIKLKQKTHQYENLNLRWQTHSIYGEKGIYLQEFFKLTSYQFAILKSLLKTHPDSEYYFHTIILPREPYHTWSNFYEIVLRDYGDIFFKPIKLLSNADWQHYEGLVVPSFTIFELVLQVIYGKKAMKTEPLLGVCTKETITYYKLFHSTGIVQVGIPEALPPRVADLLWTGILMFTYHDWYHMIRMSLLRKKERKAIDYIVGALLKSKVSVESENLKWFLMDGELHEGKGVFGELFTSPFWDAEHLQIVIKNMVLLYNFWKGQFGISRRHLLRSEKKLYDSIKPTEKDRQDAWIDVFEYYNATAHDADSYYFLGSLYYKGVGTPRDCSKALKNWKLSKNSEAYYNIGVVLYFGEVGIKSNLQRATHYLKLSAKAGNKMAADFLTSKKYNFRVKPFAALNELT